MRSFKLLVLVFLPIGVLLFIPLTATGPQVPAWPAPPGYVCHHCGAAPKIDGRLDDECWQAVSWSQDFVDIEGDRKPKPAHLTRMKMTWDDTALYIAAELAEPQVWATLSQHDCVIFQDNDFEVFLDPDDDTHMYGELELNALNTTWDLLLTKPYRSAGHAVNAWSITELQTAVKVIGTLNDARDTDTGWTVEIKWPWSGLKELNGTTVPPRDGSRFRMNFSRVEWDTNIEGEKSVKIKDRPEHNWVWAPTGVIDIHRPEHWGYVQFSTGKPGSVTYRPDPAQPTKDLLFSLFTNQNEYSKTRRQYARTLEDLGMMAKPDFRMQATPRTYEATRRAPAAEGGKTWTITHDGRLTHD